jgi:hypothetical protein
VIIYSVTNEWQVLQVSWGLPSQNPCSQGSSPPAPMTDRKKDERGERKMEKQMDEKKRRGRKGLCIDR